MIVILTLVMGEVQLVQWNQDGFEMVVIIQVQIHAPSVLLDTSKMTHQHLETVSLIVVMDLEQGLRYEMMEIQMLRMDVQPLALSNQTGFVTVVIQQQLILVHSALLVSIRMILRHLEIELNNEVMVLELEQRYAMIVTLTLVMYVQPPVLWSLDGFETVVTILMLIHALNVQLVSIKMMLQHQGTELLNVAMD